MSNNLVGNKFMHGMMMMMMMMMMMDMFALISSHANGLTKT